MTDRKETKCIYSTAYWLYFTADPQYLAGLGLHFASINKLLREKKLDDNNAILLYSTSLLYKLKHPELFGDELKEIAEKYSKLHKEKPDIAVAINEIAKDLPSKTPYGDTKVIAGKLLMSNIHPVLIRRLISEITSEIFVPTEIDAYFLLKGIYPSKKISREESLEYLTTMGG